MLPVWVVLASFLYAAVLFAIAWIGDRHPLYTQRPWLRPTVYSLALAVYCSSWTFYGAVGSAVRYGWGYLPIYLGPFLMLMFGWRLIERLALIAQSQNTVSIADFMASRYGRSQRLAGLVALIAVIAGVPYLALQYKAVTLSLMVLTGKDIQSTILGDPALYVAILMALFSILFGTRQVDATEHRPGLMLAVAFESLVKLLALVAVGVFALIWSNRNQLDIYGAVQTLVQSSSPIGFVGQTLLAFTAITCLPRQFHVAIIECGGVRDIRRARWIFGFYLIVISLMVLPIAAVGVHVFGANGVVAADSFVLALPLSQNKITLALAAYIGGFSAATGMVIVTSVALSTMVSNDLIMPLLLRRGWAQKSQGDISATVLWVRRLAILVVAAAAYGYYMSSGGDTALSAYGLITFAAVAQFAPGLIGGLYWQGASRQGVEAGLVLGFGVWTYTLLLPTLAQSGWFGSTWLEQGLWGMQWLSPYQLFGLSGWDSLTHGTFWSLLFNITAFLFVSLRHKPSLGARLQAEPFLDPYAQQRKALTPSQGYGNLLVVDLVALAGRIVGEKKAEWAFENQAQSLDQQLGADLRADGEWIQFTELLLAAAVGAASARLLLTSALRGSGMEVAAIVSLLDEAGQELRFKRDILLATLENLDQGVSVVDAQMCLVAWNQRYQQLFDYPAGMLYVGRPVADLIRFNAKRGKIEHKNNQDLEKAIARRIAFMHAGTSHVFQRTLNNKQVIELRGRPLPGGGYVTSYSDVTEYKRVERELLEINENLEQRVAERTQEAERAQQSRHHFLTAVSHDVLQPINAARLFASALYDSTEPKEMHHLAERVDASLRAAEELLDGLLDISQLDAGALKPEITVFNAQDFLQELVDQYAPTAQRRELALRLYMRPVYVRSDQRLLRRVLQNFVANALRYTRQGRIIVAGRVRAHTVVFQVWDSGQGIPPHHLEQIYAEFHRYEQSFDWGERGMGIGLSICQRIAALLEHPLWAQSKVGQGSMFSIEVPLAAKPIDITATAVTRTADLQASSNQSLTGLRVLCLDNDVEILMGMEMLLGQWGAEVIKATTIDDALKAMEHNPHVLLVDYHLHDRLDGLDSLDALRENARHLHGALLTADGSEELKQQARQRGYLVLTKPVRPASLRSFLAAQKRD